MGVFESEVFHEIDPAWSEDDWPLLELEDATVSLYPKKNDRNRAFVEDFRDLLLVSKCGPFRLEGRIKRIDNSSPKNKAIIKNRIVLRSRLIIPEIYTFSLDRHKEEGSSNPIIWALGRSGWYKIIPHQQYKHLHEDSIAKAKLWLHTEDYYMYELSGEEAPGRLCGFVEDLFSHYTLSDKDCYYNHQAKRLFENEKYRRFLMVKMIEEENAGDLADKPPRAWSTTPLYAFYKEHYPDELQEEENLLKKQWKKNSTFPVEPKAKTPAKRGAKATTSTAKRQRKTVATPTTKSTRKPLSRSTARKESNEDDDCIIVLTESEFEDTPSTKRQTRLLQGEPVVPPMFKQASLPFKPLSTTNTLKNEKPVSQLAPSSFKPAPSKFELFQKFTQPPQKKVASPPQATPALPPPPPAGDIIRSRLSVLEQLLSPKVAPMSQSHLPEEPFEPSTPAAPRPNKRQASEEPVSTDKKPKVSHEPALPTPVDTPQFTTPPPPASLEQPPNTTKKMPLYGTTYPTYAPVTHNFLVHSKTPNTSLFPSLDGTWSCEPCNFIIYDAECEEGAKLVEHHIEEHREYNEKLMKVVEVVKVEAEAREYETGMQHLMAKLESLAKKPEPEKMVPMGTITHQIVGRWNTVKK